MRGKIILDTRQGQFRKDGFPVVCVISGGGKRKTFSLGFSFFEKDWNIDKQEPKSDKKTIMLIRKKKALLDDLLFRSLDDTTITIESIAEELKPRKKQKINQYVSFYEFADVLIAELKQGIDEKGFTKLGNAKVYQTAVNELKKYRVKVSFTDFNYSFFIDFIKHRKAKGNKKSTINNYLRTYRAVYNEAVRRGFVKDTKPFKDVFKSVTVRQNRTLKRNISKSSVKILEEMKGLVVGQQMAVDLWLLQFYFGGQDFKDLYYLENSQLNRGRVYFVRGKLDETGYQFDLKVYQKAQKIIDKYNTEERFVFPGKKDYNGYKNLLRRVQKNLVKVQSDYNEEQEKLPKEKKNLLEVLPLGGNLSPKVSRHTFATIGSRMFVEPDLLRALMGHERNEIDTIYKDVYPEELRDQWHWKIIETDSV